MIFDEARERIDSLLTAQIITLEIEGKDSGSLYDVAATKIMKDSLYPFLSEITVRNSDTVKVLKYAYNIKLAQWVSCPFKSDKVLRKELEDILKLKFAKFIIGDIISIQNNNLFKKRAVVKVQSNDKDETILEYFYLLGYNKWIN